MEGERERIKKYTDKGRDNWVQIAALALVAVALTKLSAPQCCQQ